MTTLSSPVGPYRRRWAALVGLLIAEAMNLLDATIVQVAAPVIHANLPGPAADIQWFSAAYTLPFAMLLITGGRLGDLFGRKRLFEIGVGVFILASIACALAPSAGLLITTRAVQGAAAALIIPQTFGLIRAMFDGPELPKALGCIGPVMGLASVCGPVLGGVLTHADLFGSSWRAVFLVNVPLGIAVLAIARLLRADSAGARERLDLPGTALAMLGAGLVVYPLIQASSAGWLVWTWLVLAAGIAVLVLFGLHQRARSRRGRGSLVELSLFGKSGFPAALLCSMLFFAVLNGVMLVIVLQMQLGLHADVRTAGLTLLPWSIGLAVSSLLAGRYLMARYGAKIVYIGLGILFVGVMAAVAVDATTPVTSYPRLLLVALGIGGLGVGLFTTPLFTLALHNVNPRETGSAAGLLNAVQELGATLGVAVLGSVFLAMFGGSAVSALAGARAALLVAAGLLVLTAISAAIMINPARRRSPRDQSAEIGQSVEADESVDLVSADPVVS